MYSSFRRIRFLLIMVVIVFVGISLYLVGFQLFQAKELAEHARNSRNWVDETGIERGKIIDRSGEVLAYSERLEGEDRWRRISEYSYSMAHLVGYSTQEHGKSGIESAYNGQLLGLQDDDLLGTVRDVLGKKGKGNDVELTVHAQLQSYIFNLLEGHKGSVVAMDPKTGEVLAMVSSPSFDSNNVDATWDELIEREDGVLLNRATQGVYTPGSIMKVVSAVSILEAGVPQSYDDSGVEVIEGAEIYNYEGDVRGEMDLEDALVHSTNTYFANKALLVGGEKMKETAERFLFNQDFPFSLRHEYSTVDYQGGMAKIDLASSAYGQGKTLVTPLHMAMVISSISQEGEMKEPQLVKSIKTPTGTTLYSQSPKTISQVTEPPVARELRDMLIRTVEYNGYCYLDGAVIGGKTGTAENPSGEDHAWFITFAKGSTKEFALAIVLEEEGRTGGQAAAPIAQQIYYKARELNLLD